MPEHKGCALLSFRVSLWDRGWGVWGTFGSWIAAITASYLGMGALAWVAWWATGNVAWVVTFFEGPAALLMVTLALNELVLAILVIHHFAPDDVLRPCWTFMAGSAGCQLVGLVCSHILGTHSHMNPLSGGSAQAESLIFVASKAGLLIGGPIRFGLLAAALHFALKAHRQAGLAGRLARIDWAVLLAFAAYLARDVADVVVAMRGGKRPDVWEVLGWPVDPLLLFLLCQALLLCRSSAHMGSGRIGLCWRALSVGVFLTALGDVGLWAINFGYLPGHWSALTWYVWLPAAASFARAPAFQLDVIDEANAESGRFTPGSPGSF